MKKFSLRSAGLIAGSLATLVLWGCGGGAGGGLSTEAKAVADACSKMPGAKVEDCQCYAKELSAKLKPELMTLASYAQTDPSKLMDPAVVGNISANDVVEMTNVATAALKSCNITQ